MKLLYRAWFYFRIGYSTYIAFPIGFVSNVIIIYALAIKDNNYWGTCPTCGHHFPTLPAIGAGGTFAIIAIAVAIPVSVGVGLFHMKRTGAFAADASVSLESNPYIYKIVPGKEQEVVIPLMIATAKGIVKVMERQDTLNDSDRQEFRELLAKADSLLGGQPVGSPRRQTS
jgi:hypothetical protein